MVEMNCEELSTIRGDMSGIFKNTCALEDAVKNLKVQSNSKNCAETSTLNKKTTKSVTKVSTMKDDEITHQPTLMKGYITIWMVILIISVIIFMQIPNILYYTRPSPTETFLLNIFDLERCSVNIPETFQNSSKFIRELVTVCKNMNHNFTESEANNSMVLQYVYYLSVLLENSHCTSDLLHFTCSVVELEINNAFIINDNLMEKCIEVRDDECSVEWRIAESFINVPLPECESLNETSSAPLLDCPDNFGIFCGSLCQPLCAEFSLSLLNDATTIANRAVHIILYLISIVGGLTTLLACYFHRDKMFRFPLIFVVYIVISLTVSCFLMLLPYLFGPDGLLCSHRNLIASYSKSTVFCQIQGFVIQTSGIIFFGFWLLHLSHLLYSLLYPFKSEQLMKSVRYRRRVHAVELIIVLLCGVLPSIIICCTSGYRYTGFRLSCLYIKPEVLFYTFVFPISIGATIGLCILLISLKILKVHRNYKNAMKNRTRTKQEKFSTPETKLLILFSYYTITIVILLIHLVINLWIIDDAAETVVKFIFCSAGGYKTECNVFKDRLHKILTPSIVSGLTTTLLLSFINIVHLVYVIQFQDIKKVFKKLTMSTTRLAASETKFIT